MSKILNLKVIKDRDKHYTPKCVVDVRNPRDLTAVLIALHNTIKIIGEGLKIEPVALLKLADDLHGEPGNLYKELANIMIALSNEDE